MKNKLKKLNPDQMFLMKSRTIITSPDAIAINAELHGWRARNNTAKKDIPELLCLIHSEISEALEAYRNGIKAGDKGCIGEELADAVIRIFHFAYLFNIDIIAEVDKKHKTNIDRPFRHGNKAC